MSISESQRLQDKHQKEQNFTTIPVNCVEEDYLDLLTNGETERDLETSCYTSLQSLRP